MKKNIIIILFLLFAVSCKNKIFSKVLYETGELKMKGNIKNSKKQGVWKLFYKNERPKGVGFFDNDMPEGKWVFWYKNGCVFEEGYYFQGVRQGEWIEYYNNGKIKFKRTFVNDTLEGKFEQYFYNKSRIKKINFIKKNISVNKEILIYKNGDTIIKHATNLNFYTIFNHFTDEFDVGIVNSKRNEKKKFKN